jgi:hypothetical protein
MNREPIPHPFGARLDNVLHACPDCPLAAPRPFCPTCLGAGAISEHRLMMWQSQQNKANQ